MNADAPPPAPAFEKTDASPRVVATTAFALVLIVGFCLVVAAWVYHHPYRSEATVLTLAPNGRFQNGAGELTGIEQAWQEQDRMVREHLDTYGWVDRVAGVVRIPITRAIDLMVAEQKPSKPRAAQTKATP
jgi:hypothetical protein